VQLGIVATCRSVGVSVQACLTWGFERLAAWCDILGAQLDEMTPATFRKTLG
jgi:hypothetical protein